MTDTQYIEDVKEYLKILEIEHDRVPIHYISDSDILYLKHADYSVLECVKELLD